MFVKLDDDLLAQYQQHATTAKITLEQALTEQLARFSEIPPLQRYVLLTGQALQDVEQLLGGGSLRSAGDLVARTKSYASITIGKITLEFSPAQKAEIAHRAQKQGKAPKEIVEDIVAQLQEQFFWGPVVAR